MAQQRISIGMPTYNCEKYIGQSIESCLSQTYGDFELVISDNASTDGTEQVCRDYAKRDKRIRYIRRDVNIGGPGNFRYVFAECTGEYHKWTTADDFIAPTLLEKCMSVLDRDPTTVLCYPKTQLIDFEGNKIQDYDDNLDLQEASPSDRFTRLLTTIGLCQAHLGLIRRDVAARTRLIGSERASDIHFLAELALYGKFRVFPETLFFRRYHEQSSSWNRADSSHQRKYYDPSGKAHYGGHTWKKYAALFRGMLRAPIPVLEKIKIARTLARMARWQRIELANELANRLQAKK